VRNFVAAQESRAMTGAERQERYRNRHAGRDGPPRDERVTASSLGIVTTPSSPKRDGDESRLGDGRDATRAGDPIRSDPIRDQNLSSGTETLKPRNRPNGELSPAFATTSRARGR
jgi:hypothetical protein